MKKEWGADLKRGDAKEKRLHIEQKLSVGPAVNKEGRRSTPSPSSSSRKTPTTTSSSLQNFKTSNVHQISQTKIPF